MPARHPTRPFGTCLGFLLVLLPAAAGASGGPLVVECAKVDTAPAIDGDLNDKTWSGLERMTDFSILGTKKQAEKQTRVAVCHDGQRLYIAAWLFEPRLDQLQSSHTKRDGELWEDDCLEIFIDSNNDRKTYYQLIVNPNGALFDSKDGKKSWNGNITAAAAIGQDVWTVELVVPFSDLDVPESRPRAFAVNWCREDKVSAVLSSWSALNARFLEPRNFGVLLFDTKVSELTVEQLKALEGSAPVAAEKPKNLVSNGSFELLVRGITGAYPRHWAEQRWTRADRLELVTDAARAHWGRRYLRLTAPGDAEIRVHQVARDPIELQPGHSYIFGVWARREPGADESTLFVEPGRGKVELAAQWKEYTFTYSHPSDAKPVDTGMYIGVLGGPAALDDVSALEAGTQIEVPEQLKADRGDIRELPIHTQWRQAEGEPVWEQRAAIAVSELMNVPADGGLVELQIQEVFPGRFTYKHFTRDRLKVVDATSAGGEEVPWALVNLQQSNERVTRARGEFSIVFAATLPPRTTKIYHVYLAGNGQTEDHVRYEEDLPRTFKQWPGATRHVEWWRAEIQKRSAVSVKETGGVINAQVRAWTALDVSAQLVAPGGRQKISLPLTRDDEAPHLWVSPAGHALPVDAADGVWHLAVTLQDRSGTTERVVAGFTHGSALWWDSNVTRIYRDDPPRYGADEQVVLYAARNEHEAFQVAIDTAGDFEGVELSVTDAVNEKGGSIGADRFTLQRIREVYLASPPRGRSGWHPDALLPFRKCDLEAGTRKLAWITVSVPKDAKAGVYRGKILARGEGKQLELPLNLTVFDFELPDVPSFTALMGGDVANGRAGRTRTRWFGADQTRYRGLSVHPHYLWQEPRPDYTAVLTLARMLAERRMSLHYYQCTWAGAYPAPWRYDASQKSATFDFTMFDHNLGILLDELNVNCVTLATENRTGASSAGWIGDGGPWIETRSSTHRKENEALASNLDRAWARGMAAHLKEKGWLDRAFVYVTDEPVPSNLVATARYCRNLKEGGPAIKTFGAGYGQYGWSPYFDYLDALGSAYAIKQTIRKRLTDHGVAYWGVYNRMGHIAHPMAKARVIGMDSWNRGCAGFFEHAIASRQSHDLMLNPKVYNYYSPGPPGYPPETFIREATPSSYLFVYPWPEDEPLPAKQTRPFDSELIRPVSKGPGDVNFVPVGQNRPYASSLRLEALRESIDDYEYLQMLAKAAHEAPAGSAIRELHKTLQARLNALLKKANLNTHHSGSGESSIFVIDSDALQNLRRDIGRAVETALKM